MRPIKFLIERLRQTIALDSSTNADQRRKDAAMTPTDNFASPDLRSASRAFLWSRRRPAPFALRCLALAALIALCVSFSGCPGGLSAFLPIIVTITPNSVAAGGPSFTATISGTGFASAAVLINGQPVTVNSVSSTQVVIVVPASMTATPGTLTVVLVNILPSGKVTSNSVTIVVTTSTEGVALQITKMHTGNFTQGQTGATYTVTISNVSSAASTSGTVTVTEMVPSGLTLTNMAGTGWTCTITIGSCDRPDTLGPGSSYPTITITVNVSSSAGPTVVNMVTVSGGGAPTETASDETNISGSTPAPMLAGSAILMPNPVAPGGTGSYTITVTNNGTAATTGTVTVMVSLSSNQTPGSLSGTGWTCTITNLTCTISISLAPGNSYGPIMLDVTIAATPPTGSVTISGTVSGGGSQPTTFMTSGSVGGT